MTLSLLLLCGSCGTFFTAAIVAVTLVWKAKWKDRKLLASSKQGTASSLNPPELRDPSLGWRAEDPDWEALEQLGRERGWPEARRSRFCFTGHGEGVRCPECPPRIGNPDVDPAHAPPASPARGRSSGSGYRWGKGWDGPGRPVQVRDVVFGDEAWVSTSEVITIAGPPCAVRGCADAACAEAVAAHVEMPPRIRAVSEINARWAPTATGTSVLLKLKREQAREMFRGGAMQHLPRNKFEI